MNNTQLKDIADKLDRIIELLEGMEKNSRPFEIVGVDWANGEVESVSIVYPNPPDPNSSGA